MPIMTAVAGANRRTRWSRTVAFMEGCTIGGGLCLLNAAGREVPKARVAQRGPM